MEMLLIGCGYIGSILARHLSEKKPSIKIVISDASRERVESVAVAINRNNVQPFQLDLYDYDRLVKIMGDFDLVVGLAPGKLGYHTIKAAVEAKVNLVDLSYLSEDPLQFDSEASQANITIIPDCGVAPGLSNILVGRAYSLLESVSNVRMFIGGLPQERIPPLEYKITWCVEDLLEEYVRDATIIMDGKPTKVQALDGLEELDFPELGRLEAFYTDGLRTLHHTIRGIKNMWEKTLRYPGHAEKIKLLRALGLFDDAKIDGVSPRRVLMELFKKKLRFPAIKDLLAMKVELEGEKNGIKTRYSYHLLDHHNEITNISAMGRTTAYTASAVIQLLIENKIDEKGVVPPESLGMDDKLFPKIKAKLEREGIKIIEEKLQS
ncbi:MAG: saccharopine dehydrogenase NADP-binding domain-containing protein [Candidatus Bathyarchaeota archaeon]|nr:MAG: saccharopine dehydrogenase NADP-binding domain-containing protein [Candidatus Bathyarchaeota archaeon]